MNADQVGSIRIERPDWSQIIERLAGTLCLLTVAGSAVYFTYDSHRTQVAARGEIAQTVSVTKGLADTLDFVSRPCDARDAHGLALKDGTICSLNKMMVDVKKIVIASNQQVNQTGTLIAATAKNLDRVGDSVDRTADALTGTAKAATGTLIQTQTDLATLNTSIADTKPLMSHAGSAIIDLDALLKDKAIHQTLDNTASMTASGALILKNGADETTKLVHPPKVKLTIWGATWAAAVKVHELLPPIF